MVTQELTIPMIIIFFALASSIYLLMIWRKARKIFFSKRIFLDLVFIAYCICLLRLVFFPIRFIIDQNFEQIFPLEAYLQWIPFQTTIIYLKELNIYSLVQLVGNILLLTPLAVYINLIKNWNFKQNMAFVLSIALSIEILQGLINVLSRYPNNISDVDDLICNILGYLLMLCIIPSIKKFYDFS